MIWIITAGWLPDNADGDKGCGHLQVQSELISAPLQPFEISGGGRRIISQFANRLPWAAGGALDLYARFTGARVEPTAVVKDFFKARRAAVASAAAGALATPAEPAPPAEDV